MIPKNSTPIKNEILIDIIAKGLLNKDEMRIIAYIIRWSWGFNGEGRRQDWTKKLNKRKITNDIGMKESQLNRIINKMIKENKIITKDKCYQFNEHYEKWENLTKSEVFNERKLNKKLSKTSQIVKENLTKSQVKLNNLLSLDIPKNSGEVIKNKDLRGGEHLSKETLKETNKETIKKLKEVPINLFREDEEKENTLLINEEEKEKKKPNHIEFDFELWSWHGIDDDIMDRWAKIFPNVEITLELEKMREFFKKYPGHEKMIKEKFRDNYANYIFDWLERAERYKEKDKIIIEEGR
jgi:hypothetical protein